MAKQIRDVYDRPLHDGAFVVPCGEGTDTLPYTGIYHEGKDGQAPYVECFNPKLGKLVRRTGAWVNLIETPGAHEAEIARKIADARRMEVAKSATHKKQRDANVADTPGRIYTFAKWGPDVAWLCMGMCERVEKRYMIYSTEDVASKKSKGYCYVPCKLEYGKRIEDLTFDDFLSYMQREINPWYDHRKIAVVKPARKFVEAHGIIDFAPKLNANVVHEKEFFSQEISVL